MLRRTNSSLSMGRQRPISRQELEHSPLIAYYEITQATELTGAIGSTNAPPFRSPDELTPEESRQLVDQLLRFPRPPVFVITGGDPLARPDVCRLVEYAARRGLEVTVALTITDRLGERALSDLRAAGVRSVMLHLGGADAETHDRVSGRGTYDRTWDTIASARCLGISVQVDTRLTAANFHQLDQIAEQLVGPKIVLWSVHFPVPVDDSGRSGRVCPEQYEIAFEKLWRHSQDKPYLIKTVNAPHYRRYVLEHLKDTCWKDLHSVKAFQAIVRYASLGVNDGKGLLVVSHYGAIYPSGSLRVIAGMFPEQDVVDVYQNSTLFRSLRSSDRLQGKCAVCEYRAACGGSRSRAFAVSGNMLAQEPDCDFLPRVMREPLSIR